MAIINMVDDYIRRQQWKQLRDEPQSREAIREAARALVETTDEQAEFAAIVQLAKTLP